MREGLQEATSRFEAIQEARDLLAERLQETEAQRSEAFLKLTATEEKIAELESAGKATEGELGDVRSEKEVFKQRVSDLEQRLGDVSTEASVMQEALRATELRLQEVEGQREDKATELRAVKQTLESVETARIAMETERNTILVSEEVHMEL